MPNVQVTMLKGRTTEQKRRVAEGITRVLVEEAKAKPEAVGITFIELDAENFARGGSLLSDLAAKTQKT